MTLADTGHLAIDGARLEYRMIGPRPDAAPTIVMLHEGLGSVSTWGEFPAKLAERTGAGVFVYSRAGYGKSSTIALPRPLDYMQREAAEVLPKLLDAIGFRRGILLGHSDGASIAAQYAGSHQDHRVRGLVLMAPHFFVEPARPRGDPQRAHRLRDDRPARAAGAPSRRCRCRVPRLERGVARSAIRERVRYHRGARLHPRADPGCPGRGRSLRHARAGPRRRGRVLLPGRGAGDARRRPRPAPGEAGGAACRRCGVCRPDFPRARRRR